MELDLAIRFLVIAADSFIGLVLIALVLFVIYLIGLYCIDVTQTKHAIRRNYPIIGRFRYAFEHLGEFFRQYFFAMDREELPFNRAQRSWVYRTSKNVDSTVAFGSTRPLNVPGTVMFMNCIFPTLTEDAVEPRRITIGPYCHEPYSTTSLFNISGMSYGALSAPAVQALSQGAAKAGVWMNTGEGGLSEHHLQGGCDLIFQIGTAKYGVRDKDGLLDDVKLKTIANYPQVKMFEIKLSQGAKPGKGGILPAEKVTSEISKVRGIPKGQASISPNGHPEIRSVHELLDMINHVRRITGKPVGFKIVIGGSEWLDDLFHAIQQRGEEFAPDFITIDGAEGGTGAAPMSLMDYVGLPLAESLPLVVDKLCEYGLRERVKVIASGKLINAADVAWAICLGADFVTSARGFMFALGCIQALRCNKNTCPTGITTHNPKLQKGLVVSEKAERVKNYAHNMMHYVGIIAHSCGLKEPRELARHHARIVIQSGQSILLSELYPEVVYGTHNTSAVTATNRGKS